MSYEVVLTVDAEDEKASPQRCQDAQDEKASPQRRDMAFYLLTETNLVDELKEAFPNGNMILREDYQKSFKKRVRFQDLKTFLKE